MNVLQRIMRRQNDVAALVSAAFARWSMPREYKDAVHRYGPPDQFDANKEGFRPYGFPGPSGMPPHRMPGRRK